MKVFLILSFLLVALPLYPLEIISKYDFNRSEKGYTSEADDNYVITRKDTTIVLNNKSDSFSWTGYSADLFTDTPFRIEMRARALTNGRYFGFFFDYTSGRDFNFFRITDKDKASIEYRSSNSYYSILVDSTAPVAGAGDWNLLAVEHDGRGNLTYTLNNQTIYTQTDFVARRGKYVGLCHEEHVTYEVDYLKIFQQKREINLIQNIPDEKDFKITKLPPSVNTREYEERISMVSADGNTLYYSKKNHPKNMGGIKDGEEVWISRKNRDGQWGEGKVGPDSLNSKSPTWVVSGSPDGNILILSGVPKDETMQLAYEGLSESRLLPNGLWSLPEKIDLPNADTESDWINYFVSSDGQYILMSAQKYSYYGNDIWLYKRNQDGSWSDTMNLGPTINTNLDEGKPYLSVDNKTLYFYSKGHPGYGGGDMFVSRRLDDTWQNWSKPQNLGPYINSNRSDFGITLDANGSFGYLNRDDENGNSDIYRFIMPESARPEAILIIEGTVMDSETSSPLEANILYNDMATGEILGRGSSNSTSGEYKIVLPMGRGYGISAEREGYYAITESASPKDLQQSQTITKDIFMQPIKPGFALRLNNLFFETGKWDLRPESKHELNRVIKLIDENPELKFRIEGHTDNVGSSDKNIVLSQNRAKSVASYLIQNGVNQDQLEETKGFGESMPVRNNSTPEGRKYNRRVELRILDK